MNFVNRRARVDVKIILVVLFSSLSVTFLSLSGCQPKSKIPERRYELKGQVVSVDKKNRRVTIAHEEVRGFMEAMTMPFALKDGQSLDALAPGDQISAILVVSGSSSWLEEVISSHQSAVAPGADYTTASPEPLPGTEVPDFTLVNQDAKKIHIKQYRGKTLVLTFIYTRCPLPDYCPLMNTNFQEIDRELQKNRALYEQTHLLTISFDAKHDTPKVLRSFGAALTGRLSDETFDHWEFASGTPQQIKDIAQFFGLSFMPQSDQIIHSLRTVIISPDGKVYKIYRGNEWKPAEILRDVEQFNQSMQQP